MIIKSISKVLVSLTAVCILSIGAHAGGLTTDQLVRAGFDCFPAGPNSWMHCLLGRHLGQRTVSVKVFSVSGNEFLGTEQLLREDIYSGQPCPQDGLDQWDPLAVPGYFACHHFDTGHH